MVTLAACVVLAAAFVHLDPASGDSHAYAASASGLIRTDAVLHALDLENLEARPVERKESTVRVTFHAGPRGHRRVLRATLANAGDAHASLATVELSPVGEVTLREPPAAPKKAGMMGGFQTREPGDEDVVAAAEEARTLLSGADWLAAPVTFDKLTAARSQVVSGRNYFLEAEAHVNGASRHLAVLMYQPLSGPSRLSWASVSP